MILLLLFLSISSWIKHKRCVFDWYFKLGTRLKIHCLLKTILVSLSYLINWYIIVSTDLSTLFLLGQFRACCMVWDFPPIGDRVATSRHMFYRAVTLEMGGCLLDINSIYILFHIMKTFFFYTLNRKIIHITNNLYFCVKISPIKLNHCWLFILK